MTPQLAAFYAAIIGILCLLIGGVIGWFLAQRSHQRAPVKPAQPEPEKVAPPPPAGAHVAELRELKNWFSTGMGLVIRSRGKGGTFSDQEIDRQIQEWNSKYAKWSQFAKSIDSKAPVRLTLAPDRTVEYDLAQLTAEFYQIVWNVLKKEAKERRALDGQDRAQLAFVRDQLLLAASRKIDELCSSS